MPWTETAPMKERMRFVTDWERGLYSMGSSARGTASAGRLATSGSADMRERARTGCATAVALRTIARIRWPVQALPAQRVVDPAGHSASADPAGPSPAERRPRTDASHAQGGDGAAAPAPSGRAAASVQPVPPRLQRRTPPSISRRADARVAVSPVTPPVHRRPAAGRVPGPLHPQAGDQRRDDPVQKAPALHRELAQQQVLGLEEVEDGVWSIYFCRVLLARVDERDYVLRA